MKKITRAICLILSSCLLMLLFVGCEKKPGLYAWYGGRMQVDNVLTITVDAGGVTRSYPVPFDTYRAVFVYLKGIVTNAYEDDDGHAVVVTKKDQTLAVKEVTEDTLVEYYSLVALGEKYGVAITEEDKAAYYDAYMRKINSYIEQLDESGAEYKGTKEEYAKELYRKSLRIAGGMTPEYFEFTYYRDLLAKKLKLVLSTDLDDYLQQSYCHFKQVLVTYTKGDSAAETKARAAIDAARNALISGADIDETIQAYGDADYQSEIYFDVYGMIVGSRTKDSLNDITSNAIRALDINGVSDVLSGDTDDRTGYFAVFCRLGFDADYICGTDSVAKIMFEYPYVDARSQSPFYSRYLSTVESFKQNTICVPVSEKVYGRIAVNTLY